jgi:catechol 2,3-dioxygenase-like lactoylglutathione lyase family enzyme
VSNSSSSSWRPTRDQIARWLLPPGNDHAAHAEPLDQRQLLATHNRAWAVRFSIDLVAQPAGRQWSWWGRVLFPVADVDAFHARACAAGLQPDGAPRDAPWGERFFHLTDPDGHELSFATPLPGGEAPPAGAAGP